MAEQETIYIGCMTGTSADAQADFTAARFSTDGRLLWHENAAAAIPKHLRRQLLALSETPAQHINIQQRAEAEMTLTQFLVEAYLEVISTLKLQRLAKSQIILSPHGQAINHQPYATLPYSDILLHGEWLAAKSGYRVVMRHRQAPLTVSAAAPLAPVLIRHLFYDATHNTVLINGGGIANIALLFAGQADRIVAYDTGPANAASDSIIQHLLQHDPAAIPLDLLAQIEQRGCDVDGQFAARGCVDTALRDKLLSHEYFSRAPQYKSADRASFDLVWVLDAVNTATPVWQDVLATLANVVATSIADAILQQFDVSHCSVPVRLICYGGMLHHKPIMQQLQQRLQQSLSCQYIQMQQLGFDPEFFESLLMAYLGYCVDRQIAIDLSYCARDHTQPSTAIPGVMVG